MFRWSKGFISLFIAFVLLLQIVPIVHATSNINNDFQTLGYSSLDEYFSDLHSSRDEVATSGTTQSIDSTDVAATSGITRSASFQRSTIDSIERDIVLIIDTSGSMSGTPISVAKKSAIKFCSDTLAKTSDTRIAIISYNTNMYVKSNFTKDTADLTSTINSLYSAGGTNTNAALIGAEQLILDNARSSATKSIVLLTDGLPEYGDYYNESDAKYPYSQYGYGAQYASAVYRTSINMQKYDIYTLGFFHSMGGSYLTLGRQLLMDIQNKGYHEVKDADKLDFAFGDIGDAMAGDYPIIVVPGIMGSRLFENSKCTDIAWPPSLLDILSNEHDDPVGIDMMGTLYLRPFENQNGENGKTQAGNEREYGANETYKELVEELCKQFSGENGKTKREVYFFSYDFRNNNTLSAENLANEIDEIIKKNNLRKVDLVCHSMGGLVASAYLEKFGDEKLNKIITCGTPYEGAPAIFDKVKNLNVLKSYDPNENHPFFDLALGYGLLTARVKGSFASSAELAPTKQYHDIVPMWRDSKQLFNKGDYELSYDQYIEICKKIFKKNGNELYSGAEDFQQWLHNQKDNSGGYHTMLDYDRSFFIIGINQKTISSVKFQYSNVDIDDVFEEDLDYDPWGDGTVPFLSATMMKKLSESSSRVKFISTDHSGTSGKKNADSLNEIINVLKQGSFIGKSNPLDTVGNIVIRIACPVDANIKLGGDYLDSSESKFNNQASFGRLDLIGENDEIKMVCIDQNANYKITLDGTGTGTMEYEIRFFNEDNDLVEKRTFSGVNITDNTVITTGTNQNEATILNVDIDGDGNVDKAIYPDTHNPIVPTSSKKESSLKLNNFLLPNKLTLSTADTLFNEALTKKPSEQTTLSFSVNNKTDIPLAVMKHLDKLTRREGLASLTVNFDQRLGNVVQSRISINPASVTTDLNINFSTNTVKAKNISSVFDKWFNNKISVYSFEQPIDFNGITAIAMKIPDGMKAENLRIYVYNETNNSYILIKDTFLWVDKNGYLYINGINTPNIIISDGALIKK